MSGYQIMESWLVDCRSDSLVINEEKRKRSTARNDAIPTHLAGMSRLIINSCSEQQLHSSSYLRGRRIVR